MKNFQLTSYVIAKDWILSLFPFSLEPTPSSLLHLDETALVMSPKTSVTSMLPIKWSGISLYLIQTISRTLHSWSLAPSGFQNPHPFAFSPLTGHSSSAVCDAGSSSSPLPLHTEVLQVLDFVLATLAFYWMWAPCDLFPLYSACSLQSKHICWRALKWVRKQFLLLSFYRKEVPNN